MPSKQKQEAQNPLMLRCHRLIDAFAKSNEERDFYLDRFEGFIIYVDLDKTEEDLSHLEKEFKANSERYCPIPKMSFYETKKIMEGFVNEKVYDIDTKERLLDIIQSKEARENFLEFVFDHHAEYDKWQQYYQERSRIRIIEWLRNNHFHFVFEEDLDLPKAIIEKLKINLFETKVGKDILTARKTLMSKAKTYYSTEALNPRPKRGRPPKQAVKLEIEPQISTDIYTTVPNALRLFLFIPDISNSTGLTFSSKFENEDELLAHRRQLAGADKNNEIEDFNQKLVSLRTLSSKWVEGSNAPKKEHSLSFDEDDEEDEEDDEGVVNSKSRIVSKAKKTPSKAAKPVSSTKKVAMPKKAAEKKTAASKKPAVSKAKAPALKSSAASKKAASVANAKPGKKPLRSIIKTPKSTVAKKSKS